MNKKDYPYTSPHCSHLGYIAYDDTLSTKRPAILVVHDWTGRNVFACAQADKLAELGYVGFAVDMYGDKRLGDTNEEKAKLMQPLMDRRDHLQDRIMAAFDSLAQHPMVDPTRILVIGYCFGGLCALDLARSGAKLKGAVSIHGLLTPPKGLARHTLHAQILVLHGYRDPMVPPEQIDAFADEMKTYDARWQMHIYGEAYHAFTNPHADDVKAGLLYNASVAEHAWQTTVHFLHDVASS